MLRNKHFLIISGAAILGIILVLLVLVFALGGSDNETVGDSGPIFGDTSADRPFDIDTDLSGDVSRGTSSSLVLHGEDLPTLRQLSDAPVSAVTTGIVKRESSLEPYARFIERETGHIDDVELARTTPPQSVSVTTIPRIQHAELTTSGSSTIIQYLGAPANGVYTYLASLMRESVPEEFDQGATQTQPSTYLDGSFLPQNIRSVVFSPDSSRVFYLVTTDTGSRGYVQSLTTGNRTEVWDSPLRELTATWGSDDHILITSNPSHEVPGYAWRVNAQTGARDLLLSDTPSLTTLENPGGTKVLYSTLEKTLTSLRVLDLDSGSITHMPLVSLPEKCTWSTLHADIIYCAVPFSIPNSTHFPEGWYMGKVVWNDNIWRMNVSTAKAEFIANVPELVDRTIDAVDLTLAPNEDFLVFRSREDDLLWSLKIPPVLTTDETTTTF